jgi:hypothetical protein
MSVMAQPTLAPTQTSAHRQARQNLACNLTALVQTHPHIPVLDDLSWLESDHADRPTVVGWMFCAAGCGNKNDIHGGSYIRSGLSFAAASCGLHPSGFGSSWTFSHSFGHFAKPRSIQHPREHPHTGALSGM